ncbi:hypothetical protein N177_3093 [Lutibaculum baratangense AMV1]|uniref:Uncharacterized protein n=1 Tax=Lutibaculum baratangense AMV1 TaxID=631454 RepID=V4RIC0_9HYPH|nr:hypothetical protein N177_3093 [Lutibaculum baratangense AMV1]
MDLGRHHRPRDVPPTASCSTCRCVMSAAARSPRDAATASPGPHARSDGAPLPQLRG